MAEKQKVKFHYIKASSFRVVHVDGVFGGITPTGDIFASLFSQRPPIPQLTVQEVNENGELGDEVLTERVSKDGPVREMEVGLAMRPEIAAAMVKWLQEKIAQFEALKAKSHSLEKGK